MDGRFIVFDVETPNWRNDRMCSIGLCIVENGTIVEERYELIDPEEEFSAFNVQLHGISPEMVEGKPNFAELWPRLEPIFESGILAAHNAPFDMGVLAKCLRAYGIRWRSAARYCCTYRMGRACLPQSPNHKLNTLCRLLDIELDHHNAASDSRACAQLLLYYQEQGLDVGRFVRTYDLEQRATLRRKRSATAE